MSAPNACQGTLLTVELAGLPGAGKSTVHRTLVDELRGRAVGVRTPWDLYTAPDSEAPGRRGRGSGPSRHLNSTTRHLSTIARSQGFLLFVGYRLISRPELRPSALRSLRLLLLALEHHLQAQRYTGPGEMLLLDEGLMQRGLKMLVAEGFRASPELVREYIRRLPVLPRRLVVLDATPDRALERVFRRPQGLPPRFRGLTRQRAHRLFENVEAVLRDVLDALAELRPGETAVRRVPMDPTLEQILEAVDDGTPGHGAPSTHLREVSP